MLNEELELNDMSELDRGPRFLEVKCDCTNRKYGDFTGRLRISTCGHVVIACESNPNCPEGKFLCPNYLSPFIFICSYFPEWQWSQGFFSTLTPDNFLKHCGNEGTRSWKRNIWVIVNDEKVALQIKVGLLQYYKNASIYMNISSTDSKSSERERKFHRDEFIKCSTCNKERMTFRLRNREQRLILCLFRLPQVPYGL
ncbi:protein ULTRAPETALA 1-like [Juglans microcarpa x Juglans regia]|uniref:protein ULTRAPETALA 1-like n=1 Tax=Juglans microcarpa x Juglans regia TaxID=2249226 RepID=UPI001B7E2DD3|nr:protein ULTRAPETALA 1-like [Juglans microcarpa x Juglans regia]